MKPTTATAITTLKIIVAHLEVSIDNMDPRNTCEIASLEAMRDNTLVHIARLEALR